MLCTALLHHAVCCTAAAACLRRYVLCARDKGGVARFINHSCDPNLYVQPICSGHTNTDMVAIGLCAARNIPPCVELT